MKKLTHKQWSIIKGVAEGLKNKEIAPLVGTTELTIKNYLRAIYDETGMNTRLELAMWYVKGLHEDKNVVADAADSGGLGAGSALSGTDSGNSACVPDLARVNYVRSHV